MPKPAPRLIRTALTGAVLLLLGACATNTPRSAPGGPPPLPPSGLVGMTGAEVPRYLGPPSIRRREASAEIWQYMAPECLLYLFLYEEAVGPAVRHAEARDRQRKPVEVRRCAERVAAASGRQTLQDQRGQFSPQPYPSMRTGR